MYLGACNFMSSLAWRISEGCKGVTFSDRCCPQLLNFVRDILTIKSSKQNGNVFWIHHIQLAVLCMHSPHLTLIKTGNGKAEKGNWQWENTSFPPALIYKAQIGQYMSHIFTYNLTLKAYSNLCETYKANFSTNVPVYQFIRNQCLLLGQDSDLAFVFFLQYFGMIVLLLFCWTRNFNVTYNMQFSQTEGFCPCIRVFVNNKCRVWTVFPPTAIRTLLTSH